MNDSLPPSPDPPGIGIYVHFPWCLAKCPYCDFLSLPVSPAAARDTKSARAEIPHDLYADAVIRELKVRAQRLGAARVRTIFFGGGTPSLWAPSAVGRVLSAIYGAFQHDRGGEPIEVTAECNPTSLDTEQMEGFLDAGVNRFSIGVQSLEPETLRFLGRLHDAEGGLGAVSRAVERGKARVSADLIYGVTGQSAERAVDEVLTIARLGVGHLSAYTLTIEPNTRFGALARKGKLPILGDEIVADSFLAVSSALEAEGFEHYEISNFARAGQRSLHNQAYWRGQDYLGLGVGAVGTVRLGSERIRYKNLLVVERYMEAFSSIAKEGNPFVGPLSEREIITAEMALVEALLLGLRTNDGLDLAAFHESTGHDPWTPERARAIDQLERKGLLEIEGALLKIPTQHWIVADNIIRELV